MLDSQVTKPSPRSSPEWQASVGDEKLQRLSSQEERILAKVAEGKTNREIGDRLKLSEKTIKNYLSSNPWQVGVTRRAEAAAYFVRRTTTPGS